MEGLNVRGSAGDSRGCLAFKLKRNVGEKKVRACCKTDFVLCVFVPMQLLAVGQTL